MGSTYCCPNCNEGDASKFTKHYDAYMKVDESRVYSIDELEDSNPDADWNSMETERGEFEEDINEEFSHFNCGSCGQDFDEFKEIEDEEEEEEEEEEDMPETVAKGLTNINPVQKSLRRELSDALENDDLVIPSDLVTKIRQSLDSNAAEETLKKLLEFIREL